MLKKRLTAKEKLLGDISLIVANKLSLTSLDEFEDYNHTTLFTSAPDTWCELEIAICDYTMRIQKEILNEIEKIIIK